MELEGRIVYDYSGYGRGVQLPLIEALDIGRCDAATNRSETRVIRLVTRSVSFKRDFEDLDSSHLVLFVQAPERWGGVVRFS